MSPPALTFVNPASIETPSLPPPTTMDTRVRGHDNLRFRYDHNSMWEAAPTAECMHWPYYTFASKDPHP